MLRLLNGAYRQKCMAKKFWPPEESVDDGGVDWACADCATKHERDRRQWQHKPNIFSWKAPAASLPFGKVKRCVAMHM